MTAITIIDNGTINYRDELVRKLIHLCSLSIPLIYLYFLDQRTAIFILAALSIFAISLDLLRYQSSSVGKVFYKIFGFMLRKHEVDNKKKNLNGATYVLLSALLCIIVFPKVIFVTGFIILIISDTTAALIGRKFGRHKFLFKSFEGTLAFFISAIIVVLVAPKVKGLAVEYYIGFIAAFIGAIVENISFGIADDNLSIPVSIGVVMYALYYFFLPGVSLALTQFPK
ncbi:MAG: SEC59/DGK1/VTE5 family protein [Bacteroidota bacterium]|nr:SEC59/DGK1/VTE5 family protein [Bacteroidota bacterium]